MAVEIKVPVLAESVADATLLSWHKNVGDYVRRDENLVDLETDKVVLEITAPKDGVLTRIRKKNGATVTSEEIIAEIDPDAKAANAPAASAPAKASAAPIPEPQAIAPAAVAQAVGLSPAVRRLIDEHSLDPTRIEASGKSGRLTKADVLDYLDAKSTPGPVAPEQAGTAPTGLSGARPERRVPFSRLRARVAERLKEAQNTAAILTTFNEVDMKPVMDLRNRYKDTFVKQHGVKLGFMSFFVKAVVEALKSFPVINASVDGNDIVYHGYYDIGIAVSSPRGLVVPILRDADLLSFAGIEQTISDYGARAQDGKLSMDELTGGTFSISNGGVFGSMLSTPILNPPQSAILGMHNIVERPVVENGEIVIRPMMYLALSYDHRIIDGSDAVLFLVAVKKALEDPARMLLSI